MSLELSLKDLVRQAVKDALADLNLKPTEPTSLEFLTLDQAASMTATSKSTIRNWIKANKLKTWGTGRIIRIRRDELELLMKEPNSWNADETVGDRAASILLKFTKPKKG
jgi:excisionase family DNA binding protein